VSLITQKYQERKKFQSQDDKKMEGILEYDSHSDAEDDRRSGGANSGPMTGSSAGSGQSYPHNLHNHKNYRNKHRSSPSTDDEEEREKPEEDDNDDEEDEEIEETIEDILNESGTRKRDNSEPMEINTKQKTKTLAGASVATKQPMPEEVHELASSCHYIPMRLTPRERLMLNVLENALEVCEYTDVVDVTFSHTRKSKSSRIIESLVDTLSISCGLMCSNNLKEGEQIMVGRTLNDNVPMFCDLFEVGRRFKIMNPAKMRNTYGKLMYLLMDAESYNIKAELKVNFVKPILTIARFLDSKGAKSMLEDPLLLQVTLAIPQLFWTFVYLCVVGVVLFPLRAQTRADSPRRKVVAGGHHCGQAGRHYRAETEVH
jgi:hypothetical protein